MCTTGTCGMQNRQVYRSTEVSPLFFHCPATLSGGISPTSSSFVHIELCEFCRNIPFHCKKLKKMRRVKNHNFLSTQKGRNMNRA